LGVPAIGTVSEKRSWVEKALSSLSEGFDKKRLLESSEALEDPELRSLIATSLTATMARRKLEQYLMRLGTDDSPHTGSRTASATPASHPESPGSQPASPPASSSPDTSLSASKPKDVSPSASPDALSPLDTTLSAAKPKNASSSTKTIPDKERSSERFSRLEKTVLASKSSSDLSIPDISEDMIGTIRQLKDLARRKTQDTPKTFTPKKKPVRSNELLEALDKPRTLETIESAQNPQTPARESIQEPVPSAVEQPSDSTLEEFEAFLDEPASSETHGSELFSDDGVEPVPDQPVQNATRPSPSNTRSTQKASTQTDPGASEPVQPVQNTAPVEPRADITMRFDELLSTMNDINTDLPHPVSQSSPSELENRSGPAQPQQIPISGAVRDQPPMPSASPVRDTRMESGPRTAQPAADATLQPVGDARSSVEASELQAPTVYDGSWIEQCETITDVIEALRTVEGSIEDVRRTIALYVLGFSEDLARTIRTAQDRDEIELMLRKALTMTIDDAFERTSDRFAKEQASLSREAQDAAEAFDEAVSTAIAQERLRSQLEASRFEPSDETREVTSEHPPVRPVTDDPVSEHQVAEPENMSDTHSSGERPSDAHPSDAHPSGERPSGERPSGERPSGERPDEPSENTSLRAQGSADVLASARAAHEHAEHESADDLTPVPERAEPPRPTLAARIAQHIESLHDLIEHGEYDEALERLAQAREMLERQITLKEHRNEPVVDERMADFELKGLALDLEILKARE